jgi:hypothetical protein
MLQIYFLFFPTFAKVAHSAPRDETPEEWARDQTNRRFEQEAHRGPPWEDYNKQGFISRAPQSRLGLAESDRQNALPPTRTPHDLAPTRTYASLTRRAPQTSADLGTFTCIPGKDCYTFSCPTSVQCADGGCCPIGDYCGIKEGMLGCCTFDVPCDTAPIPGCSVSCYGICCDLVQDIIGEPVCSPTPGRQNQASGICTGVGPENPLYTTPTSCPGTEFLCGPNCCPGDAGLVCDNTTIPGSPFCNIPAM